MKMMWMLETFKTGFNFLFHMAVIVREVSMAIIKLKRSLILDIFILTSRYEGMPMGVLEVWSYGILHAFSSMVLF